MDTTRLEALRHLFSSSHEYVLITDFSMHSLWHNQVDAPIQGLSCRQLFGGQMPAEVQSGTYSVRLYHDIYRFRVLRSPNPDNPADGFLVFSLEDTDAIQGLLHCGEVREALENYTGKMRQSVTGVSMAVNVLHGLLEAKGSSAEQNEWLNIIINNCYQLLKGISNVNDMLHFSEEPGVPERIDFGKLLQSFTEICAQMLGEGIHISCQSAENLFLFLPVERLVQCLLSLLLTAQGQNDAWNDIRLTAREQDGFAVLDIYAAPAQMEQAELYCTCPLYEDAALSADRYLIRRFCDECGGKASVEESDGHRCCTLRLPLSEDGAGIVCCSPTEPYENDRFSRYHTMLSEIGQIKFF